MFTNKKNTVKNKKTKLDKILFGIIALSMIVLFIIDLFESIIPDENYQLKILISIVSVLSTFLQYFRFYGIRNFLLLQIT